MDTWTQKDFENGWCSLDQVGKQISNSATPPNSADFAPSEQSSDEQTDLDLDTDDALAPLIADFQRDHASFIGRNPPNVSAKIMDVLEKRRLESVEQERKKILPTEQTSTSELRARVEAALAERQAILPKVADTVEAGVRKIVQAVRDGNNEQADAMLDQLITWLRHAERA
jgi:hypothetical protein